MQRVSEMRYRATCAVEYRYTCSACGETTGWFVQAVKSFATSRKKAKRFESPPTMHSIENLEKAETKALNQLMHTIHSLHEIFTGNIGLIKSEPLLADQYNEIFINGKRCPRCKARQPWYPASAFKAQHLPEVVWGEPDVSLVGALDESEYEENYQTPDALILKKLERPRGNLETFPYWHLSKIGHENLPYVFEVIEKRPGVFSIMHEKYQGQTLASLLVVHLSQQDFEDIVQQLCDALEALHSHEPPIVHGRINMQNVMVSEGNLAKLINFDNAVVDGNQARDIAALGTMLRPIREPYIKKYTKLFDLAIAGKIETVADFKKRFHQCGAKKFPYIFVLLVVIVAVVLVLSRRVL